MMNILVTQPFKIYHHKSIVLQPFKFCNQKVIQATNLVLHVSTMMVVTLLQNKKRYEEGYDLFIDADYVRWIKIHHPDTKLPTDSALICILFLDIVPASPIGI